MRRVAALVLVIGFMAMGSVLDLVVDPRAEATLAFGFLLLAAYLAGDVLSRAGLPRITGYILTGIAFGPHALGLVSQGTVADLKLIDDLALTFIALAAGGELRLDELRQRRRSILLTVLFLSTIVFLGVGAFTVAARPLLPFLAGRPITDVLVAAVLLGIFAVARSPSSAVAIISETKARGPFTETVLGVTVVMDVLVIVLFAAAVSICQTIVGPAGEGADLRLVLVVFVELLVSILAGLLVGGLISLYITRVAADRILFLLALAFGVTFASRQFAMFLDHQYDIRLHLEPMLICLTAGFYVRNFSAGGEVFAERVDRSSLPIYVLFFSLTGASLRIEALRETWLVAVLLVVTRAALIWIGAYTGARLSGDPPRFRRWGGLGYLTQAGVSLGLAGIVAARFPGWGVPLATTIVAVIAINQVVGPAAFKLAVGAVGEAGATGRRASPP